MVALRRTPFAPLFFLLALGGGCSLTIDPSEVGDRDPRAWPFTRESIWNLPLGDEALGIEAKLSASLVIIDTIVVLKPDAPAVGLRQNTGEWNSSRCVTVDTTGPRFPDLPEIPVPDDFLVARSGDSPPPDPWSALDPDGATLHEGNPFGRCVVGGAATSINIADGGTIDGEGLRGGHPLSGMSVLGGTLRLGELVPGAPRIRHALKLAIPEVALSAAGVGYRWPATKLATNTMGFAGTVGALKMGALLALPADADVAGAWLETEPARQLAWTLQHFGAYVVRSYPAANRVLLFSELGPDGAVADEFEVAWGYRLWADDTPFTADMQKVLAALEVVDDWDEAHYQQVAGSDGAVGVGGGAPRAAWAAPLRR